MNVNTHMVLLTLLRSLTIDGMSNLLSHHLEYDAFKRFVAYVKSQIERKKKIKDSSLT